MPVGALPHPAPLGAEEVSLTTWLRVYRGWTVGQAYGQDDTSPRGPEPGGGDEDSIFKLR